MKSQPRVVGVRELKTHLSAYLRAVAQGETIVVGDRRKQPIARLEPVSRSKDDDVLQRLAGEGILTLGRGKPGPFRPIKLRGRGKLASEIIIEQRG